MMKQLISLIALILTNQAMAQSNLDLKYHDPAIQNQISSCMNKGEYLVRDKLTVDQGTGKTIFKRTLFVREYVLINKVDEPESVHKIINLGPKLSYSVSEAEQIFGIKSQADLLHLVADNGGWKCLTQREIKEFHESAEHFVLKKDFSQQLSSVDIMGNSTGQH